MRKAVGYSQSEPVKTILVTSPNPMEGKSIITSSLAMGLARNNCKVLIVDADMRRPQQQKMYQTSGEKDLSTFLSDKKCQMEDVIRKNVKPGIDLLPSLIAHNDPTDLFQSTQLGVLFEKIKIYDVVLFDTPALLAAPDAYSLATLLMVCSSLSNEDARPVAMCVRFAIIWKALGQNCWVW